MKPDNTTESINAANTPLCNNQITEERVLSWLAILAASSGIDGIELSIGSENYTSGDCFVKCTGASALGHTFAEAIATLRKQIPSAADQIAKKRAQARALENEAALLELKELNAQSFTLNTRSENV